MILKLIYILCLLFSALVLFVLAFYEKFYASKADSIYLSTEQFLPLKDVAVSDALMAMQKDNASPKIVKNIYNDSSNILNASSSVSELTPQTYPGNKSIDIEKENKIASHREHPALANVTSIIYKSTDFLLFENETLVGKYRPMNSTKFDDVNQTRDTGNVAPSDATNFDTMNLYEATSTRAHALHRMARADKESVQTVLKKIFPDRFFPKKSNSDLNGSRNVNYRNNNSPRRRQKIKNLGAGRFGGQSVYFRANSPATGGEVTTTPATNNAQSTVSATNNAQSPAQTAASGTDNVQTAASGTDASANSTTVTTVTTSGTTAGNQTGVSSGRQVNYHYHFHYFGGLAAPTLPGGEATTTAQSQK